MLGKSGLLGSYFLNKLENMDGIFLQSPSSKELDVLSIQSVENYLSEFESDFVINCTGYTAVDNAETDRENALKLNAEAVGTLASACKKIGSVLIHFSTDYVFNGENPKGYEEDSPVDPINFYGESKLAGEKIIQETGGKYYIVRTSWLFGRPERDFVRTMLKLSKNHEELSVVTDQIGSPTYASDLADAVIDSFVSLSNKPSFGVYHITNSEVCSWHDFATEIFRLSKIPIKLNKVDSSAFPRPSKRPHCSVLLNTKLKSPLLRPWKDALKEYLEEI